MHLAVGWRFGLGGVVTISGAVMATPPALLVARMPIRRSVVLKDTTQIKLVTGLSKGVPMQEAKQGVAKDFSVIMRDPSTGFGAPLPGLILNGLTVLMKKGGATSYVTITPTLTAVGGSGLLNLALTASHLDTLGVAAINITGPGVLPNDDLFIDVVAFDKNDSVRGGLSALPDAVAGSTSGLPLKSDIPSATSIRDAILDAARTGHITLGSVGEAIALSASLLQGNFFIDQTDNSSPNGQTAARLRCFHTGAAANAATPGGSGEGEFATFLVTTTYTGPNKIDTHRVVQQ